MKKTVVHTAAAPAPLGPYSQGIMVEGGRTLYIAGQVPVDPASGALVGADDIVAQTNRVLDNVAAVLREAGMDFHNLVKVGIFVANFDDFAAVNEVYGERFTDSPPVRTTVEIARFPKGFMIEIDGIAVA